MQFMFDPKSFQRDWGLVSKAVSSRPSHPVLATVKVAADRDDQVVRLTAFDLEKAITIEHATEVIESGECCLSAKLVGDLLGKLKVGSNAVLMVKDLSATIVQGRAKSQVQGIDPEEMTELPVPEASALSANVDASTLFAAIAATHRSISTDATKQVLCAGHLNIHKDLTISATDGHRLIQFSAPISDELENDLEKPIVANIPKASLLDLQSLISVSNPTEVTITSDRSYCFFEWMGSRLFTRVIDGQYPNVNQLLPRSFDHEAAISRPDLIAAIERVGVITDSGNHLVQLTLDDGELHLLSTAQDVGESADELEVQYVAGDRGPFQFSMNTKYTLDALKSLSTTEVLMKAGTPTSPVVFTGLGGSKVTCLVMPVQVRP